MMKKPLGYMSGFLTILMVWFFEHTSVIIPSKPAAKPRMLRWSEFNWWSTKFCTETFNRLQQQQVFETFREVSKEERGLLSTSFPFIHSPDIFTRRSLSPKIKSPPASPPYSHHLHVGTSYVSTTKLSSTTTPISRRGVNIINLLKSLESRLENRLNKLEDALFSRMSDVEFRLKNVEERLGGHESPTNAKNVDKGIGTPTFEPMQNEGTLHTSLPEDEQVVHEISQAQEVDPNTKSLLDSLVLHLKIRQLRKRKAISTPYIDGERKKMNKSRPQKKVSPEKGEEGAKGHQMKRLFPWEDVVTISLDDSSDSDFEEHKQGRVKRDKKDCSSENLGDITSEGTLIRMAGMYQEYMKRIPIPTFSGSVVPFTSWQSLAESLKQLYGQPLHYLTNSLLKQWDRERFGSYNERQPLDAVVHPVKAQTLIWLTEELHRLTASPYYLAKLWASDPMYHSQIDPFLSY